MQANKLANNLENQNLKIQKKEAKIILLKKFLKYFKNKMKIKKICCF